MPAFPIMLLLLFLGASSKKRAGGPTGGDGGGGGASSSQPVAAKPAANARPGAAHPAATAENDAAAQAAVDAVMSRVVREEREREQSGAKTLTSTKQPEPPQPEPAPASAGRTAQKAAEDLRAFLLATNRFGSAADRPEEVRAAQRDLGVADDGIVGPATRAAARKYGVTLPLREQPKPARASSSASSSSSPSSPAEVERTPRAAAEALRAFLQKTKRHGTKKDRPAEVRAAQRDLGVTDDGVVGPETRAAAKRAGVTLPARPKG
jgi:murein L,D-transpeptidase YcbB/YkuD